MKELTKELTITISGEANTGKSTIALLLEEFLQKRGFNAEIDLEPEIEDYGTEFQFRAVCTLDWLKRLRNIKSKTKITIKQIRVTHGSKEENNKAQNETNKND